MAAKESEIRAHRQFVELKETLLFGEGELKIFEETGFEGNDGQKEDGDPFSMVIDRGLQF